MLAPLHVNFLPIWDKQSTKCYSTVFFLLLRTSESEQGLNHPAPTGSVELQ